MKQFNYVVQDENGIHARPAGLLVRAAKKYSSDIQIKCSGKSADIKSIFAVMGLGVKKGDSITITVSGEDEAFAVQEIEKYIKTNF